MIDLTQRISIGRQFELKSGDLILKLVSVVAQVYDPLLQLVSPHVPQSVLESRLYRHPHSIPAANKLLSTGQFSHCENCTSSSCPVNELYARMFCCVYFFVMQYKGLTDKKFGVGSVSIYLSSIENYFCHSILSFCTLMILRSSCLSDSLLLPNKICA